MAQLNQGPSNTQPNVVQFRHAIYRGSTKVKVPAVDLAAAPVPTDEEAAGIPPSAEQIAAEAHGEMARAAYDHRAVSTVVIVIAIALVLLVTVTAILWTQIY